MNRANTLKKEVPGKGYLQRKNAPMSPAGA
jgi:hypothetical protein